MSNRFAPLLPLLAMGLLFGCPALTHPNEGDPGYGSAPPGSATATNAHTVTATAKPTGRPVLPAEVANAADKIRASHLLVGWKGAAGPPQERSKEEARQRVEAIIARLKKGEDFGKLAQEFGEDGTKTKGGDLGEFDRGTMVKPFADAAFALKPDEVSGVVETQFGFHVIKRTK